MVAALTDQPSLNCVGIKGALVSTTFPLLHKSQFRSKPHGLDFHHLKVWTKNLASLLKQLRRYSPFSTLDFKQAKDMNFRFLEDDSRNLPRRILEFLRRQLFSSTSIIRFCLSEVQEVGRKMKKFMS